MTTAESLATAEIQATLVVLRHGSSMANEAGSFGGWEDAPLSPLGVDQARRAGEQIRNMALCFDLAATSVLSRAIWTLWHCLDAMDRPWTPQFSDWRLNERHYGSLQGTDRAEAVCRHGEEQVQRWRRTFSARPPLLKPGDARDAFGTAPYRSLGRDEVPLGESLQDTRARVHRCWNERVLPVLAGGGNVLLVAHGNSIRALLMTLEGLDEHQVVKCEVAHAEPLVYHLQRGGRFVTDKAR